MKITQADARKFRAKANRLEAQLQQMFRAWGEEYPEGVCIGNYAPSAETIAKVVTARTLRHAVVVTTHNGYLYFHALPQPQEPAK